MIIKGNKNKPLKYTCPMHPDVVGDEPGNCPTCGMKLVAKQQIRMAGTTTLMLLLCLIPAIALLLLPLFGIRIHTRWVLFFVLAAPDAFYEAFSRSEVTGYFCSKEVWVCPRDITPIEKPMKRNMYETKTSRYGPLRVRTKDQGN